MVGDVTDDTSVDCTTTVEGCPPAEEVSDPTDDGSEVVDEPTDSSTDAGDDSADTATETDGADSAIVSLVAKCASNGRMARTLGAGNHGSFVSAAAHGETVTVGGVAYDLSTMDGATAFCAAIAAAEAAATEASADATTADAPKAHTKKVKESSTTQHGHGHSADA